MTCPLRRGWGRQGGFSSEPQHPHPQEGSGHHWALALPGAGGPSLLHYCLLCFSFRSCQVKAIILSFRRFSGLSW